MPSFSTSAVLALLFSSMSSASGNNALSFNTNTQNGKHVEIAITLWGSDFYFAICACMAFTALTITGLSYTKPRSDRIFFYLCAAICFTASIAYFSMGSNLGWTPIDVEFPRGIPGVSGRNREIYYVRYIDWFVTTPLLLTDLLLTAGLPWPSIGWTIFLDLIMVITGLVGALVKTRYKWGFFVFGCVAMFGVFYELAVVGRANAKLLGKDVHRVFMMCGVLTLFLWCLYPVAWGLCEGGNVITPNDEAVFYGCLDLLAKPGFSICLLAGHWNIDPARLGLRITSGEERSQELLEKSNKGHANGGHVNGADSGTTESTTQALHADSP